MGATMKKSRRGGIYAMVMIGSATVTTMALAGLTFSAERRVAAERAANSQAATQLAKGAIEIGLQRINSDPQWRWSYSDGWWMDRVPMGDGFIGLGVFNPQGAVIGADPCGQVRIRGVGAVGTARTMFEVDLVPEHLWPDDGPVVAKALGAIAYWPNAGGPAPLTDAIGTQNAVWVGSDPRSRSAGVSCTSAESSNANSYIKVDHHANFEIQQGAVAFWFLQHSSQTKAGLFSKDGSGRGSGGRMSLWLEGNAPQLRLRSTSQNYAIAGPALAVGEWHHLAATFGPLGLRLYVNGQLQASDAYTGGWYDVINRTGNTEPIIFCGIADAASGSAHTPIDILLDGAVAHASIYKRQLTDGEILTLIDAHRRPPTMRILPTSWRRVVD
jgi:hypothetical protein